MGDCIQGWLPFHTSWMHSFATASRFTNANGQDPGLMATRGSRAQRTSDVVAQLLQHRQNCLCRHRAHCAPCSLHWGAAQMGCSKHVQLIMARQPAAAAGASRAAAAKPWPRRPCARRVCGHRRLADASRVPAQDAPVRKQAALRRSHLFGWPEGPLQALETREIVRYTESAQR